MAKLLFRRSTSLFHTFNVQSFRMLNSNTASVTKIKRQIFAQTYPTLLVYPDGSSTTIRYHEPRRIVRLPLDMSTLSEEERKIRLERRKPKKKVVIVEEIEDNFNADAYLQKAKKSKK